MKSLHYILPLVFAVSFSACEQAFFEPEPQNDQEAIFEDFWTTYHNEYANFEERGVDWDAIYALYRPQVDPNTTDDELFEIFQQMLWPLKDAHIKLIAPNRKIFTPDKYYYFRFEDDLFDLDLIKAKYMQSNFEQNGYGFNTFGRIGNVGYVHFRWISDNMADFGKVLESFSDTDGLIIDLRHNGGGDFTWAFSEFGPLTNEKRYSFRSRTKNGPGENDFGDWFEWNMIPGGTYFDKPLVMLTDRYTISAGERATLGLKTLPNLIHMGDTTNGASATIISRELANGWYYTVMPQEIEFRDGVSYEGPGVPPDVLIENTVEEMNAGQDKALEAALARF